MVTSLYSPTSIAESLGVSGINRILFIVLSSRRISISPSITAITILWFNAPVNDYNIPVMNTCIDHAVAGNPHEESGRFVPDELFIEVNTPFHVIISSSSKSCGIGGWNIELLKLFTAAVTGFKKSFYFHILSFNVPKRGNIYFVDN
jgi:hypothetical protein